MMMMKKDSNYLHDIYIYIYI